MTFPLPSTLWYVQCALRVVPVHSSQALSTNDLYFVLNGCEKGNFPNIEPSFFLRRSSRGKSNSFFFVSSQNCRIVESTDLRLGVDGGAVPCKTSGATIHFVHGKTASSDDYDYTTHVPHRERFRCNDRCKTHVAKRKGQKVILVSYTNPFFSLDKMGIVRTLNGGTTWTKHSVPFQITGPLLFHPRQENWILARGSLDGKYPGAMWAAFWHSKSLCNEG
ncbi:uncharacterized protein [Acropora muricata]|uniref:uncharacterized protein isoform X2 n=1 Tax=Acropora muricata TaxID=159855 RepID=UPI0034E5977B